MQEKYNANAYKQAYVIANFLIENGNIAMPQELLDILEDRMNKDYYFDMHDIEKIELLPDTEKILTQIYLECMVNQKEKEKIHKLTNGLKKIILDIEEENVEETQGALILANLAGLKFLEKIKITFNRMISFYQI